MKQFLVLTLLLGAGQYVFAAGNEPSNNDLKNKLVEGKDCKVEPGLVGVDQLITLRKGTIVAMEHQTGDRLKLCASPNEEWKLLKNPDGVLVEASDTSGNFLMAQVLGSEENQACSEETAKYAYKIAKPGKHTVVFAHKKRIMKIIIEAKDRNESIKQAQEKCPS